MAVWLVIWSPVSPTPGAGLLALSSSGGEATSNLDAELEQRVGNNLRRENVTDIVAGHRAAALRLWGSMLRLDGWSLRQTNNQQNRNGAEA